MARTWCCQWRRESAGVGTRAYEGERDDGLEACHGGLGSGDVGGRSLRLGLCVIHRTTRGLFERLSRVSCSLSRRMVVKYVDVLWSCWRSRR